MEDIDRISSRVTLAACLGALGGAGTAVFRGTPMGRTVGFTALSCALSGTACFGSERVASRLLLRGVGLDGGGAAIDEKDEDNTNIRNAWELTLGSHAIGGTVGGALLGAMYGGRPGQGALFFTPLMLLIGTGEKLFEDMRNEIVERSIEEQRQRQQQQRETS